MAQELPLANSSNEPTAAVPLGFLVIGDQEAEQGCVRLKSLRAEADEQSLALDAIPVLLDAIGVIP